MTERVPCKACSVAILLSTAEKNCGLCMPCKSGYRKNIEDGKTRYEEEKKRRLGAEFKHWRWLVDQVYATEAGFQGLSGANKLFFAANLVSEEVYNGGFEQYFHNSSADYYVYAVDGLIAMGAMESHKLLLDAKNVLFGEGTVQQWDERRDYLACADEDGLLRREATLNKLDKKFWSDPDKLSDRMINFTIEHNLLLDFQ